MTRKMTHRVVLCLSLALNIVALLVLAPHLGLDMVLAGTPSGNGDVNGSGGIDIADAIYILGYLFKQGPEPIAIESEDCDSCCPPSTSAGLPATGQTKCYGGEEPWAEIDCASAEYPGQDGFYQKGCAIADRFADNGDGTVTDACTGLVWQKEIAPGTYTWPQALQYCESLELAGRDDWRLPNVRELQSIVDYGRESPSLDPIFGTDAGWFWMSTTSVRYLDFAWTINFDVGSVLQDAKDLDSKVRAVRG